MRLSDDFTSHSTIEQRLFRSSAQKRLPVSGSFELLPLCNMNCDMCYVRMSPDEVSQKGRIHTAAEWLSLGQQMHDSGVLFLLLTGGEPLLHPEFKDIYLGLKKMGFVLTVNTNGTLIDEEWVSFFREHKPRRMNITLYGSNSDTYADLCHYRAGYEKVIHAIKMLRESQIDVKVSATIAKKNQSDLLDILATCKQMEVPVSVDSYLQASKRERNRPFDLQSRVTPQEAAWIDLTANKTCMSSEQYHTYVHAERDKVRAAEQQAREAVPEHMACYAGKCSFAINWQGEMRPCVILHQPAVSLFDLSDENENSNSHTFVDAWNQIVTESERILLNSKCTSCKYRPICRTCAASALYETGDYNGIPEYQCQYAEELYRLLLQEKL